MHFEITVIFTLSMLVTTNGGTVTIYRIYRIPDSVLPGTDREFHLDDIDTEVIARDIVLLELIDSIDPDKLSDIEYIWDVWYNMTLSEKHHERLMVTLERLVGGASSSRWCFGDKDTKRQVQATWKYWLESKPWDVLKVKESRQKQVDLNYDFLAKTSISNTKERALTVPGSPFYKDSEFSDSYTPMVTEYNSICEFGCARDFESDLGEENEKYINPTMMRPGSDQWYVYFGVNPLAAYLPLERNFAKKFSSLVKACIASLQLVIKQFVSMCAKIKLVVTFWSTDVFALCHLKLSPEIKFDLIHTSNLADHVGLLNLLVTCEPRLRGPCSVLVTETFRWSREWQRVADHIEANTCCPPLLLPTALGLRLGEDFDLGSSKRPPWILLSLCNGRIMPETIRWVKCLDMQSVPISLSDSPDIAKFLTRIVDLCFPTNVNNFFNYYDGQTSVSPLALPCILQRLQHLISGGIGMLVSFVDGILKSRLQQVVSYTMTWDVLCQAFSLRSCSDEILIIQMHFPHQFLKPTDQNMVGACLPSCIAMPNLSEMEMDLLMDVTSGFTNNINHCSELFQVYTFNADDKSFSIPILQSAWNRIPHYQMWVLWMYKRADLPFCKRDDGDVFVATKFNSSSSSETLPSGVMENQGPNCSEFEDRYELQTTVDNKGLKIKLEPVFLPHDSLIRTAVQLIVNSAEQGKFSFDVTWNFSCCLVPSRCNFQISSKTGCIRATLAKETEYYNVGQSALPLRWIDDCELTPFSSPDDIQSYFQERNLLKAVFMSPRDIELRRNIKHAEITDPFYCLRRTIADVWEKSYEIPTMKTLSFVLPGHENLDIPFSSKIDIQVRGYFLFRGLPLIKITFIDPQKAKSLIMEGDIPEPVVLRKRQELIRHEERFGLAKNQSMGLATIYEQEYHVTRRLLITNSLRIRQDRRKLTDSDWYWDTYLELLFDRTRSTTNVDLKRLLNDPFLRMPSSLPITEPVKSHKMSKSKCDKSTTSVENVPTKCAHCNQSSSSLKRCSRCHIVSYCGRQCQVADWSKHKVACGPRSSAAHKAEVNQPQEEIAKSSCLLCHKTEVELKRCARCQSVSYCSKECQKIDWKNHKLTCR